MTRSILSVSAGLAAIAVVLASLWIGFGPRSQGGPDKRASAAIPLSQQQRSSVDARGQTIRTITPGSPSGSGMAATAPPAASPSAPPQANPSGGSGPSADASASARTSDTMSTTGLRTETAPGGVRDPATPPPGEGVDLNTASVEQLNGLGAGMIGRRIVEFRPYTAPDELLTRRVLKRADYDAIKNAITVR